MAALPKKIGWIGLGIMGLPMVRNMLAKMESDTDFYVYDVIRESIDKLVQEGQGRVHACNSSKEVADNSVCHRSALTSSELQTLTN
jgi:3-hydroxyisobutyrate dehydrogenase